MQNPFTLENKTILVTGASSGIGKSVALECSKMGAQVIITGRNEERLEQTYNELHGYGNIKIATDLSMEAGIYKLVEICPKLDGIVHVAGIVKLLPFSFISRKELDEIMDINFYAPVALTNLLLRQKNINKFASIVFISSISGVICSSFGGSVYSASKGALNGIVKGMALDLAPRKIRVNTIMPGMINTGIFDNSAITKEDLERDEKHYPLGRYGKPEEVAYATVFLLSDASSWTTGTNLLLDGGYTLN